MPLTSHMLMSHRKGNLKKKKKKHRFYLQGIMLFLHNLHKFSSLRLDIFSCHCLICCDIKVVMETDGWNGIYMYFGCFLSITSVSETKKKKKKTINLNLSLVTTLLGHSWRNTDAFFVQAYTTTKTHLQVHLEEKFWCSLALINLKILLTGLLPKLLMVSYCFYCTGDVGMCLYVCVVGSAPNCASQHQLPLSKKYSNYTEQIQISNASTL